MMRHVTARCARAAVARTRAMAVCAVVMIVVVLASAGSAESQGRARLVLYVAPVDALVVDGFRPPAHIGASGNRGLEYGTTDQTLVLAAADGQVSFSGQVGGRGVIVVEHPDGVRTTYTGLSERWAVTDAQVNQGHGLGLAGPGFHFGARIANEYLDPQILIDASQSRPGHAALQFGPNHPVAAE